MIADMGTAFAKAEPFVLPALRTLDQSCADIHNPHTSRASEQHA
jgi:hypothetical protein